jgi:hypothetical protein
MNNSTTIVMNVITEEKMTYYNTHSLEDNLISAIISSTEDVRKLMHCDYRNKISSIAKIEKIHSINGNIKYYSQTYDMIAYKVR